MAKWKRPEADGYQIFKDIVKSGSWGRLYVLHGDEPYLIQRCRSTLRKKLVSGPTEEFNFHPFTEENWDLDAFSDAVDAIPMMSEHSLVEVTDVDFFSLKESQRDQLAGILSDIPDYCTVLLIYDALDWKPDKRKKKLYAPFSAPNTILEINRQSESTLGKWIVQELSAGGKSMPDQLVRYLILQTGGSMSALAGELSKLICYSDQPVLTRADIDAVVIPVLEAAIFDITRDIGTRNYDNALQKMKDLLRQDTEPIVIAAVIGRQMRQMYAAKVLSEHGKDAYALMQLYGIRDFAAKEVYRQAQGYKKEQLRLAMAVCAETDYAMKTSFGDGDVQLETMILRLGQLELAS